MRTLTSVCLGAALLSTAALAATSKTSFYSVEVDAPWTEAVKQEANGQATAIYVNQNEQTAVTVVVIGQKGDAKTIAAMTKAGVDAKGELKAGYVEVHDGYYSLPFSSPKADGVYYFTDGDNAYAVINVVGSPAAANAFLKTFKAEDPGLFPEFAVEE